MPDAERCARGSSWRAGPPRGSPWCEPCPSPRRQLVSPGHGEADDTGNGSSVEAKRLWRWLAADLPLPDDRPPIQVAITSGIPGVEICRFAEANGVSLLVLGRKQRSAMGRMLLGDTADSVARRSRIPCLFVPHGLPTIQRVLAALDGSERGQRVLAAASEFASAIKAELRAVTVEAAPEDEPPVLAHALPLERSARLLAQVAPQGTELEIRRGPIAEQLLAAVEERQADVLVIGYHRGGLAGAVEAGSTARRLAHAASSAVLTIPL